MKEGKIRFYSIFISDQPPIDTRIDKLKKWCAEFQKNDLTPIIEGNFTGNLSFRSRKGFVITASGLKSKENLNSESFVYVKDYCKNINTFYIEGKKIPSSESIMHHLIYKYCEGINSIFHGHNDLIVANSKKMGLNITKTEYEPGTIELAKEVLGVLGSKKVVVLKNHGFISVGKTMNEAGELALSILKRSKEAGKRI